VISDENRVPSLKIKGEALEILADLGAEKIHLSMSHTTEHAVAQVILERD
jgi:holo-[acyl-carrier protein] synthase